MILSLSSLLQQCFPLPRGTVLHRASHFRCLPSPCSRFGMSFLSDIVVRDRDSHSCGLLSLLEKSQSCYYVYTRTIIVTFNMWVWHNHTKVLSSRNCSVSKTLCCVDTIIIPERISWVNERFFENRLGGSWNQQAGHWLPDIVTVTLNKCTYSARYLY